MWPRDALTLFLCGDVMTGRGIDQVLPHPSQPRLYEPLVRSSTEYVAFAEAAHGHIPRAAEYTYVWGAALDVLNRVAPDVRIVNLETAVTTSEEAAPKGINYRMHPANAPVLSVAGIDCCVLANNHVLDWGRAGLCETLDTLAHLDLRTAGAGRTLASADAPATLPVDGVGRVLVFAFATPDSGVPASWAARSDRPGVSWVENFSDASIDAIATRVIAAKGASDVAVASIHWGDNWGFEVPADHRRFAHALIDRARIDVVHGHSSHHAKAIEVYHARPIFYGCGDFLTDYEGIPGKARYRDDLVLAYFPTLNTPTRELVRLRMVPFQIRRFRLQPPSREDRAWLARTLDRECRHFGRQVIDRGDAYELIPLSP